MLAAARAAPRPLATRAPHFFASWVRDEWGRTGSRFLTEALGGAAPFLARHQGFAAARIAFDAALRAALRS